LSSSITKHPAWTLTLCAVRGELLGLLSGEILALRSPSVCAPPYGSPRVIRCLSPAALSPAIWLVATDLALRQQQEEP
jgi:hypothetical protein